MITAAKQALRKQMREVIAALADKAERSHRIATLLRELPVWQEVTVIYAYSALPSEPDWRTGFADEGKLIAYPRVVGDAMLFYTASEFALGSLGTWEPTGENLAPPADLILVPGIAFDASGHRLGRGKGFYDRWLAERGAAQAIGLGYHCQLVPTVPREPHDIRLDAVITETQVF